MRLRRQVLALLLLAIVMIAACGVKGPPRPPRVTVQAADAGVSPDGGD